MTTITSSTTEQWYDKTWLVIILCLFVFPVGLYALWKSQKFSKGWKIAGTAIIVLFVIAAFSNKSQATEEGKHNATATKTTSVKDNNSSTDSEQKKSTNALFDTPEDFKNAFNTYASSNDLDLEIDNLEIKEGSVQNTFQYMFDEHLGILGTVKKSDGSVKEVTMLGSGDGTYKSGSNMILCMGAVIATVDPTLKAEKRGDILKNLGLLGDKDVDLMNMSSKTEQNGIKYFINSSPMTGLMFGASRK